MTQNYLEHLTVKMIQYTLSAYPRGTNFVLLDSTISPVRDTRLFNIAKIGNALNYLRVP